MTTRAERNGEQVAAGGADVLNFEVDHEHAHGTGDIRIAELVTEAGERLPNVTVHFETWGTLNAARDNVVVVCHALTGDAHAGDGREGPGWWSGLVGPGRLLDTRRYFVIASNVIGGCAGTTGPSSLAPDGHPYGIRFPVVTIRDMVTAQGVLLDALQITGVNKVIGGSMGGMQAWEWPLVNRQAVEEIVVVAAHTAFTPLAIGYNYAMRQAIVADPDWRGGNYYESGRRPEAGLAAARAVGMLTYRSNRLFAERFGRNEATAEYREGGDWNSSAHRALVQPHFAVESWLAHHGGKLNERFDANSYLYLTRAMDYHDIGHNRGGRETALRQLRGLRVTVAAVTDDYLYTAEELQADVRLARDCGLDSRYLELQSTFGHDAFLADQAQLAERLGQILT